MICYYCGRTYPVENLLRVRFKNERQDNIFCQKCFPEVTENMKSVPWYEGYELRPFVKKDK